MEKIINYLLKPLPIWIEKLIKVIIIVIFIIALTPFLLFSIFKTSDFIRDIKPVPLYQKIGTIDNKIICEKIKNSQLQEVCFTIAKDKDFERDLALTAKTKDDLTRTQGYLIEGEGYSNNLKGFPWYYNDGLYFPNQPSIAGIEKILKEGKKHNSTQWCKEFSTFPNGIQIKENYYLCMAFLENPYYCDKTTSETNSFCYQDSALIYRDPALCEKASEQDFCYIRLVLIQIKKTAEKNI